jgi:hypothetical protein
VVVDERDGDVDVVLYDGDVAQVEPVEQLGDQPGVTVQGEVGVGLHRIPVRPQWQRRYDAAVAVAQLGHDVPPQRRVHTESVQQHQDGTVATGVVVLDGSGGQLDLRHAALSTPGDGPPVPLPLRV